MDAILNTCHHDPSLASLEKQVPFCLLPLGNKPLVEHCLDHLSAQGVSRVFLIIDNHLEDIRASVEGSKWGLQVQFVPVSRFPGYKETVLKIWGELSESFLFCPALYVSPDDLNDLLSGSDAGIVGMFTGETDVCWRLEKAGVVKLENGLQQGDLILQSFQRQGLDVQTIPCRNEWRILDGFEALWQANMDLSQGVIDWLVLPGREIKPGIVAGKGVQIHSRAELQAPLRLGRNVRIEAGARVGPHVLVADESFLDRDVHIQNCLVGQGTYIGRGIDLEMGMVFKNILIRYPSRTVVHIPEAFILGGTTRHESTWTLRFLHKVLAFCSLLILSPMWISFMLYCVVMAQKDVFIWKTVLGQERKPGLGPDFEQPLPTRLPLFNTQSSFLARLPLLWSVLQGRLALVGIEMISPEEGEAIQEDWAKERFQAPPGLFNPWHSMPRHSWDWSEKRVMEVYYVHTRSVKEDLKIIAGSLRRFVLGNN